MTSYTREEAAAKIEAATATLMEALTTTAAAVAVFNLEVAHVCKCSPHLTGDEREQLAAARETLAKYEKAIRGMTRL